MKLPNNKGNRAPAGHLLSPKVFSPRSELPLIKLLAKGLMGIPKQSKLLTRPLVALHKLLVRPYCWRKYRLKSLNMEKSCGA